MATCNVVKPVTWGRPSLGGHLRGPNGQHASVCRTDACKESLRCENEWPSWPWNAKASERVSFAPLLSKFPASHGYFAPTQYRFPLPRMNMLPPVNAGVATDSSPSLASPTGTNALDARKTCIVPPLSIA